ncbi:MAG TPA: beta-propeller domain-containing protein [Allosphingosinicella sp.]|nr:beta-propeller domain-containing protein [Allosphingosinicella sp.]
MRQLRAVAVTAAMLVATGCATPYYAPDLPPERAAVERRSADRALARWTPGRLERFADEAEFRRYLRAARRAAVARGLWWEGVRHRGNPDSQEVVVTGSRVPARNASITNVQEAGVDEGDIVKQIDRFLIVLQDGRLFAVDTGAGRGAPLRLTDRMNVYRQVPRDRARGVWYDEMLVFGDRIVVTGYSYPERASELSVFRLDEAGRFTREGTFFLASNDYYDRRNYATRLVDGNLLIYTPLALNEVDPGRPIPWPFIRRWRPGGAVPEPDSDVEAARLHRARPAGRPLFAATDIYRPLVATLEPTVHSFTLCPLGPDSAGEALRCRTTAIVGGAWHRYYVSPAEAFLVTGPGADDLADEATQAGDPACGRERPALADVWPTQIYRIPFGGGRPGVVAVRGAPFDQFSMQARGGHFRLLVNWGSVRCGSEYVERAPPTHFTFLDVPLASFSEVAREMRPEAYTALPSLGAEAGMVADRFTERYVVYGSLGERRLRDGERSGRTLIGVVPVDRPEAAQVLSVPHNVIRAEQAGENVVLTGYRSNTAGLDLSLIDLRAAPRVAATHSFERRFESEGRSHAFNALVDRDGAGLLALPTVPLAADGERRSYWSRPSDMDFLRLSPTGALAEAGRLETGMPERADPNDHTVPGYSCEVSCTDWYGNSRPIFTDGRIFALLGTELIEGRLRNGRLGEVQRLDIARVPVPGR